MGNATWTDPLHVHSPPLPTHRPLPTSPQAGYTDVRCSAPPPGSELDANLGRLPCLEVDGVSIGQSTAINYFIAQHCGLLGSSPAEAAKILSFQEHIKELRDVWSKNVPWGTEPTAAFLETFFDDASANDYTGPANGEKRAARHLLWFMGRMEGLVGSDGFAVGGKFSLADVLLFNCFADSLTPEECATELPAYRREPFSSLSRTSAALAKHPKIAKIVANVAAHPNIKKWMAERGKQGF